MKALALTSKQITAIKELKPYSKTKFHGNTKTFNSLPVGLIREVVSKKLIRANLKCETTIHETPTQKVIRLISIAKEVKGTNYAKILIEGSTGIYLAHPAYRHSDYNKSRVFDKNEKTIKLMRLYNSIVSKF